MKKKLVALTILISTTMIFLGLLTITYSYILQAFVGYPMEQLVLVSMLAGMLIVIIMSVIDKLVEYPWSMQRTLRDELDKANELLWQTSNLNTELKVQNTELEWELKAMKEKSNVR